MATGAQIDALIQEILVQNPTLAQLLGLMADNLNDINNQLNPPATVSVLPSGVPITSVDAPLNFTATVFPFIIQLTWEAPNNAVGLYEIRMGDVDWDSSAVILTTATLIANLDPISLAIQTSRTYTFRIRAKDDSGNLSAEVIATLAIGGIGAPAITPTVISNNVLLNWTIPASDFQIDHYVVKKNGIEVGTVSGTFEAFFEITGGSFNYTVIAFDIIGNSGAVSPVVTVNLTAPTDYAQQANLLSMFTGTKINCYAYTDPTIH